MATTDLNRIMAGIEVQTFIHRNANMRWGKRGDANLRQLYSEGKSVK